MRQSKKISVEIEILDPESFCPVVFKESVEKSFLIDGQPGLRATINVGSKPAKNFEQQAKIIKNWLRKP